MSAVKTVLVVDDEPSVLRVASKVLRRDGYEILEALGGEEALRIADDFDGSIKSNRDSMAATRVLDDPMRFVCAILLRLQKRVGFTQRCLGHVDDIRIGSGSSGLRESHNQRSQK